MILKSLTVGGFKNVKSTRLNFTNRTLAVISPNNYGKSNLLEALDFATDFISAGVKQRTMMMAWVDGIPIARNLDCSPFQFDMEFELPEQKEYRFVHYGFTFSWYRDDKTGQKILDERLEMRPTESVRYSSYLKRPSNQYRKGKSTGVFRNLTLEPNVLAVDVLSSIEDLEYTPIIQAIRAFEYRVCDTLDVKERFQPTPIRLADDDDKHIRFDDEDIPRALHQLKEMYPDQYYQFEDAVYSLFPDFSSIDIQAHELNLVEGKNMRLIYSNAADAADEKAEDIPSVPFHLKDKVYRVTIRSDALNQPVSLASMSTGTKRIFWLLTNIFIASCNNVSCIGIEELETSIHPKMLKDLLNIVSEALENTCLVISSHSPYLVQYLKPKQIYVGTMQELGVAQFRGIAPAKEKKLLNAARSYGLSVGEYLFELMSGESSSFRTLQNYLEGF
ncbi:AAA family ATPase [Faecalibacterium prausnitzii]|uniref:AAA family ATPase n=1 Tax=Faecalibacterium prausnitzii TaxID=853 RepID=UPI001C2C1C3C|nr:ATP-binding protein [Faecalibacterium prausnitzii]MBV0898375.1 AAA family ATPase [Faecalibacterium prausnitzii]MCQ5163818.1 AAA family ATPase [Faecalibacterium prausnitzii]MCQ5177493.1 AAA family ATPase [Faecalibacterium prausnitzii]